ncbi:histone acetyltransferase [Actinomortierella ambigua]|nr:histone acetyltransferase [Actinomortierella ambigua]
MAQVSTPSPLPPAENGSSDPTPPTEPASTDTTAANSEATSATATTPTPSTTTATTTATTTTTTPAATTPTVPTTADTTSSGGINDGTNNSSSSFSHSIYPPADKPIDSLSSSEKIMKVARSCPCDGGLQEGSEAASDRIGGATAASSASPCDCRGWRPKPPGMPGRADTCGACGHKLTMHGGPWHDDDFERRLKAAQRRDELLNDKGKLLDFDYEDEDIISIKKQIQHLKNTDDILPPSTLPNQQNGVNNAVHDNIHVTNGEDNIAVVPDTKDSKVRTMEEDDDGEDNEQTSRAKRIKLDEPTTAPEVKLEDVNGQSALDSSTATTTANGHDHLMEDGPTSNGAPHDVPAAGSEANGQEEPTEEEEEEASPPKKEKPAVIEERQGLIEFRVISNDGSRESMVLLTGMKNIFQKQLPKMPREYIARLVYDRMAIVKSPLVVLGGITYRPFNHRQFAEIVFCAITSTEQVKGYGSHLMNHLKDYISEHTDVRHFLTYADNYAIGYFKKQGFTKEITLDKSIWMGYIKDYEGGTIMQCTTVPKVKYLDVHNTLQQQRKAVVTKIKEVSKSHIIHPGLKIFQNGVTEVDPMTVPGIKESGWDPEMDNTPRVPVHGPHYNAMKHIVAELIRDPSSWPFLHPVDVEAVTDYYSYIKDPMDLSTLESNVDADVYESLDDFAKDCKKIFDNCRVYNGESTPYVKCANKLEKVFKEKLKEWKEA